MKLLKIKIRENIKYKMARAFNLIIYPGRTHSICEAKGTREQLGKTFIQFVWGDVNYKFETV